MEVVLESCLLISSSILRLDLKSCSVCSMIYPMLRVRMLFWEAIRVELLHSRALQP